MINKRLKNSVIVLLAAMLLGTLSRSSFAQDCWLDLSPPNDSATMIISSPWAIGYNYDPSVNPAYFKVNVTEGNAVIPAGDYLGWCVEIGVNISPNPTTYGTVLFSSCDTNLNEKLQQLDADYDPIYFLPSVYVGPEVWHKVNYILSHRNGAYFWDVQLAIWSLIGGPPKAAYYSSPYPPSNISVINQLLADAEAYAPNWTPGCGDKVAAVVVIDTWPSPRQLLIIEIPIPCTPCIGVEKLVACIQPTDDCGEFGKFAAGYKGSQDPAFCYQVTVTNCSTVLLTNLSVLDSLLGDITTDFFPDPTDTLAGGGSVTASFKMPIGTLGLTTNTVIVTGHAVLEHAITNGSEVITNGTELQDQDEAVVQVDQAAVTCAVTLKSACDLDGNTNDNHVLLPGCSPCDVTFHVHICNPGAADLTGVTITSAALTALGYSLPAEFDLAAGNCADYDLCTKTLSCPSGAMSVSVAVDAEVKTDVDHCGIYDLTSTNAVEVSSECTGQVECSPGTASICGFVFDCETNGLPGVTVTLADASSNVVATTTTAANGGYCFTGLTTGLYIVVVTPPANSTQNLDPDSIYDNQTLVLVTGCNNLTGVNFGYTDSIPPVIVCPSDLVLCPSDTIPAPDISSVTATDNAGAVVVTLVSAETNGVCPKVITRVYRATDDCGNTASCTQTITIGCYPPCTLTVPNPLPVAESGGNTLSGPAGDYTYAWSITTAPGSGWAITSATNIQTITYTAGLPGTSATFKLVVTDKTTGCSTTCQVSFSNQADAGCTPGFWGNKNGLSLITSADFVALNAECLRNGDGSNKDFTGSLNNQKSQFAVWLKNRTAVNMAYQFSAHLAAFTLNVRHKFICGNTVIPVSAACGGPMTANDLIAAANSALCADGYTPSGDANRAYQECLKNALANANQNCTKTIKTCP